jgi:hypothetical protein
MSACASRSRWPDRSSSRSAALWPTLLPSSKGEAPAYRLVDAVSRDARRQSEDGTRVTAPEIQRQR